MLTELLKKLKTWFFQTPKRYLDGPNGPKELPGSEREVLWVIPRSELVHRVFDFPEAVLDANKDSALSLQLSSWVPFENAKYAFHWTGARASVFAWDGPAQEARKTAKLGAKQRVTFVPRPFIEAPFEDGSRLLEHEKGFEAQHWQDGSIAASRWWPREPEEQDLIHFYRGAKTQPLDLRPSNPEVLAKPWHHTPSLVDQAAMVMGDGIVVRYASVATFCIFGLLVGQFLVLSAGEAVLRGSLSSDQTYFAELREQRRNAILSRQDVRALSALKTGVPHVALYDAVLQEVEKRPVRILIWSFVPERLIVTLRSDEPLDPTEFITAFEASEYFENVLATTVGREQDLRIEMDLRAAQNLPGSAS